MATERATFCPRCGRMHTGICKAVLATKPKETPAPVSQQRPTDDAAKPSLRDSQARREQPATAPRSRDGGPPKRDRAAYMRKWRAEHPKVRP